MKEIDPNTGSFYEAIDCECVAIGEGDFLYSDDDCIKCGGKGWVVKKQEA